MNEQIRMIKKIWNTLSNLIGKWWVYQPKKWDRKAIADAFRYEKLLSEQTEQEYQDVKERKAYFDRQKEEIVYYSDQEKENVTTEENNGRQQLQINVNNDSQYRNFQRYINTRKIAIKALNEPFYGDYQSKVSEKDIDPDWFAYWRSCAEDVTREEMQNLWARILAGEVHTPGSYSKHTLELLSRISMEDARLIERIKPFCLGGDFLFSNVREVFQKCELSFSDLIYLEELNILKGVTSGSLQKKFEFQHDVNQGTITVIRYHSKAFIINADSDNAPDTLILPAYTITLVGRELLSLLPEEYSYEYRKELENFLNKHKHIENVKVGDFDSKTGNVSNIRETDAF